jgi:transposase
MRSRIVLAYAQGASNTEDATDPRVHVSTVGKWRRRFLKLRLEGLIDEPWPGRPPLISLDQVEDVVVTTWSRRHATPPTGPTTTS